jgi:hypothetical protein
MSYKSYTFENELFALENAKTVDQKTKLLKDYCSKVIEAVEVGKNDWDQAAYEIVATFRFDLDDIPGYENLFDFCSDIEVYGVTEIGGETLKELVQNLG